MDWNENVSFCCPFFNIIRILLQIHSLHTFSKENFALKTFGFHFIFQKKIIHTYFFTHSSNNNNGNNNENEDNDNTTHNSLTCESSIFVFRLCNYICVLLLPLCSVCSSVDVLIDVSAVCVCVCTHRFR